MPDDIVGRSLYSALATHKKTRQPYGLIRYLISSLRKLIVKFETAGRRTRIFGLCLIPLSFLKALTNILKDTTRSDEAYPF